jgi:hypothetical protein
MPWKASSVMEERLRFVARLLDGEAMTEVCRGFGGQSVVTRTDVTFAFSMRMRNLDKYSLLSEWYALRQEALGMNLP